MGNCNWRYVTSSGGGKIAINRASGFIREENSSGGKHGGSLSANKQAERILSPKSKSDYIERAEFIADVSSYGGDEYSVSTSDWIKGDKDRTYINMTQYRNGKYRGKIDMGYIDNQSGVYVKANNKIGNLGEENLWNMRGTQKYTHSDIADILKKKSST